jgi:hypothetical protein
VGVIEYSTKFSRKNSFKSKIIREFVHALGIIRKLSLESRN